MLLSPSGLRSTRRPLHQSPAPDARVRPGSPVADAGARPDAPPALPRHTSDGAHLRGTPGARRCLTRRPTLTTPGRPHPAGCHGCRVQASARRRWIAPPVRHPGAATATDPLPQPYQAHLGCMAGQAPVSTPTFKVHHLLAEWDARPPACTACRTMPVSWRNCGDLRHRSWPAGWSKCCLPGHSQPATAWRPAGTILITGTGGLAPMWARWLKPARFPQSTLPSAAPAPRTWRPTLSREITGL